MCRHPLAGIVSAIFALPTPQASAKESFNLELVMATDVSWSIDEAEAQL